MDCLVVPTITNVLPMVEDFITNSTVRPKVSSRIDMLLDAEVFMIRLLSYLTLNSYTKAMLSPMRICTSKYRISGIWKNELPNFTSRLRKYAVKQITQRLLDEMTKDIEGTNATATTGKEVYEELFS
ncbi:hypothetical protein PR048_016233 [Dryococelus australis]|uniref:Uncharacterized protein n=1 Tax=Dryococelus australis TaxID=614101 RepID=A0ABQ9HJR7_9NEOP|nr:hypothetical protein PR048_016233 [Dryococelus australis]